MLNITSAHNDTYKKLLSLTTAKGLKKEKLFLLSGEKLVREYIAPANPKIVHEIFSIKMRRLTDSDGMEVTPELFDAIDVLGTGFNILVLQQPEIETIDPATHKPKGMEVVIPIGDPGNLGALLRSCEAFGVPRVILSQESAHPFLPKAVKASAGSVLRVPMLRGPALKDFPAECIALDMDGDELADFKWPKDGMLVVGEEGMGVGGKFTQRVTIPTNGVESLNAVVAASIALAKVAKAV